MGKSCNARQLAVGGLTLADLDAACPHVPVMIATFATLAGQVNSTGSAKPGITPDTKAASGIR